SMSPRLDSRWSGSFPLPGRELHPLEAPGFAWRAEKLFEVEVHDIPEAGRQIFLCSRYRLMCRPPWPKAVAVVRKRWVEDGLKDLQHCLLDKSVERGGDGDLKLHLPPRTLGFEA